MVSVPYTDHKKHTEKDGSGQVLCHTALHGLNLSGMIECKKIKKFLVQVEEQESTEKRIYTKMTTQDPEDEYADYLRPLWDTGLNVYYDQPNLENW